MWRMGETPAAAFVSHPMALRPAHGQNWLENIPHFAAQPGRVVVYSQ